MGISRVENLLELDVEVDEVLLDSLEDGQSLVHYVQLLVRLHPFEIVEPLSRIRLLVNLTGGTGKEESPLIHVNLVVSKQNLCAE